MSICEGSMWSFIGVATVISSLVLIDVLLYVVFNIPNQGWYR